MLNQKTKQIILVKKFSLQEISNHVNGEIIGITNCTFTAANQLESAENSQISIIGNKKYEKLWQNSKASAAIVNHDISIQPGDNKAFIKVKNADIAMSKILDLFASPLPIFTNKIHKTAVIDESATIGKNVKIGAGVYIGHNVTIGNDCTIYPNATILDDCKIGNESIVWSGAVIRERSEIGNQCIIHPNATIGADGFGFVPCPEKGLAKITHIGNVIIGNNVEIGANSCVDRGKFGATIIGDGCKIDNLVQIGHNCKLGKFCIMAGKSGLAGSVTLGDGVVIGGSASIKDHVTIGSGATVGAGSGVTCDIEPGKVMLGYPAVEARNALKQWAAIKQLIK